MGAFAKELLARLYRADPYEGFDSRAYALDLRGEEADFLRQLLADHRPRLVVEVGSWKGDSAIQMATTLKGFGLDGAVCCVDTWLGSLEHLLRSVPGWDIDGYRRHGFPTLYYQFLANVLHTGCQDVVVPFPMTSSIAARWFACQGIQADFIYVDGSHEEEDVYHDLVSFWKVLRPGGVMVGDDWHAYWYGVICAVNRFARERELQLQVHGPQWILIKPP
jgi:SAM-dependent methyltransferase